jgi:hypothetical protein
LKVNEEDMIRTHQNLCSDTMLNYHLLHKLKLIEKYKFNLLINNLTFFFFPFLLNGEILNTEPQNGSGYFLVLCNYLANKAIRMNWGSS